MNLNFKMNNHFVLLTVPLVMFIGIYRTEKITYQITNMFLLYKYLLP